MCTYIDIAVEINLLIGNFHAPIQITINFNKSDCEKQIKNKRSVYS